MLLYQYEPLCAWPRLQTPFEWRTPGYYLEPECLSGSVEGHREIEFVQFNDGQSHAALQTHHFSPISKDVLFMRANAVWTMLHWYSYSVSSHCLSGGLSSLHLIHLFIHLSISLYTPRKEQEIQDDEITGSNLILPIKRKQYSVWLRIGEVVGV